MYLFISDKNVVNNDGTVPKYLWLSFCTQCRTVNKFMRLKILYTTPECTTFLWLTKQKAPLIKIYIFIFISNNVWNLLDVLQHQSSGKLHGRLIFFFGGGGGIVTQFNPKEDKITSKTICVLKISPSVVKLNENYFLLQSHFTLKLRLSRCTKTISSLYFHCSFFCYDLYPLHPKRPVMSGEQKVVTVYC